MTISVHLRTVMVLCVMLCLKCTVIQAQQYDFRNSDLPIDERVNDLVKQLTLEEKISLFGYNSPGVERLGVPKYNWWNEALHGVARAGNATIFPQAIAMAATFDDDLIHEVSSVISLEARAKYNLAVADNRRIQYMGLTFWSPNINIFRDPRWGRGQETYGEDPFLTSKIGLAFMQGIQGDDDHYLRAAACAKHFAVHSGPEANRHTFNAIVDEVDLRETYLYAFKKLIDGGVESVMCGYNRLNDEPCCTNNTLIDDILRKEWGFQGHVVTDCWALEDIWLRHKYLPTSVEVAAEAIKTGVNLDCSNLMQDDLMSAIDQGLLKEEDLDDALKPTLKTQFKLGFYDDAKDVPFSDLGVEDVHTAKNIALTRKVAQESMVLLKNEDHLLPIKKDQYQSIMVVGTNASSADALLANYHGVSDNMVTFTEGIVGAAGPGIGVQYDMGSDYSDTTHFGGIWAAQNSDITIAVIGLTPVYEGEEGDAFLAPNGGDKADLKLPKAHIAYMKALRESHDKPIIAVVTAGSAVDIKDIEPYADAIILAWYPGEQGGNALADILFGKVSPSGKLPITFYESTDDLPPYDSYDMQGRTYRYYKGKPLYPFGFGMSYTSFGYEWVATPQKKYKKDETIELELNVSNEGSYDGDEVIQAYIGYPDGHQLPLKELRGFKRVHIEKGQTEKVHINIPIDELKKWNANKHEWYFVKGDYSIYLGSNSDDQKLTSTFTIK